MLDFATKNQQLIGMFILTFLICRIPKVGVYFRCINTFFHEVGHAIFSILTSGSVERIDLFADTTGAAYTRSKNIIGKLIVPLAGYPFAAAASFGAFWLLENGKQDIFIYAMGGISILALILWVRNGYGIFWLVTFTLLLFAVWYFEIPALSFYVCYFFACMLAIESLYSSLVILYLSAENPKGSGDAANLRKLTYVPAVVWGILFAAQALFFAAWIIDLVFQKNLLGFVGLWII